MSWLTCHLCPSSFDEQLKPIMVCPVKLSSSEIWCNFFRTCHHSRPCLANRLWSCQPAHQHLHKCMCLMEWWVRVKNFWPGSGRVNYLWLGSGQPIMVWVWNTKIYPKNVKFFNFFPLSQKKLLRVGSESTRVEAGSASYLLRIKSKLGSGQGPSLVLWNKSVSIQPSCPSDTEFNLLLNFVKHRFFDNPFVRHSIMQICYRQF